MDITPISVGEGDTTYLWVKTDGGRASSKRPKQTNDCTVRALALARGIPYDEAYNLLAKAGRPCSAGFRIQEWLDTKPWAHKLSFPAVAGERRMNPASFVTQFPKGIYICRVAKHVFTVRDGVVFDALANRIDRCIYTAWRIDTN